MDHRDQHNLSQVLAPFLFLVLPTILGSNGDTKVLGDQRDLKMEYNDD